MSDSVWSHRWQPPGSPIPGILQARTLEWIAISFSNAWKWKGKVKSFSRVQLLATPWTAAYQAPPPMGFSRQSTGVGCHCLLQISLLPLAYCESSTCLVSLGIIICSETNRDLDLGLRGSQQKIVVHCRSCWWVGLVLVFICRQDKCWVAHGPQGCDNTF